MLDSGGLCRCQAVVWPTAGRVCSCNYQGGHENQGYAPKQVALSRFDGLDLRHGHEKLARS